MKSNILLIGATGRIGACLVDELIGREVEFSALARSPEKAEALRKKNVTVHEGSLEDSDSLRKAMQGQEKLFITSSSLNPAQADLEISAAAIARDAGVRHIIKVSALGTGPDSRVSMFRGHGRVEEMIKGSGMAYTFLHPSGFMQNYLQTFSVLLQRGKISSAIGDAKVGMIDTRDIACVAAEALLTEKHNNTTYELTGPEGLTMEDIASKLGAVSGREFTVEPYTPEEMKAGLLARGMEEWLASDMVEMSRSSAGRKEGAVNDNVGAITGRRAYSFDEFLEHYLSFLSRE